MKDEKNSALDKAISAMRDDTPSAGQIESSAAKVWAGLEAAGVAASIDPGQIRGCADIRVLLPAYSAGQLAPARALLVRDHLHECVTCRNLAHAESPTAVPWSAPVATARQPWGWQRLAFAATILVVIGLTAFALNQWFFAAPEGMRARVQSV
ncbi:MAG TPA: zf-HC2 domain-containing protein, partial [Terriglobales bacterium]|nr:zf-HC2 domain-containing protein [Terriglobales bacterium]